MIRIKNSIAGGVTTAAVLCYIYLDNQFSLLPEFPEKKYYEAKTVSMPNEYDNNTYYTVLDKPYINEQIEIIHSFVSNLLENSQDLDSGFSKTIDKHFWDLV